MSKVLNVDDFPEILRRRMKSLAAMRGITLRLAVIEAVEHWCDDESRNRQVREEEQKDGS